MTTRATVFDNSGNVTASEFQVNTTTDVRAMAITALDDGGFVVTWTDYNDRLVKARIFDADGTPRIAGATISPFGPMMVSVIPTPSSVQLESV